jgi:hypothetical protein
MKESADQGISNRTHAERQPPPRYRDEKEQSQQSPQSKQAHQLPYSPRHPSEDEVLRLHNEWLEYQKSDQASPLEGVL